jgi:hypothetical protein
MAAFLMEEYFEPEKHETLVRYTAIGRSKV